MAVPLDAIRAFHNAFRKDMADMDAVAYAAARGKGNLDLIFKRYAFFNEALASHASGEEEYVFPALENVAPLVAEAYERDHRGLDALFESLHKAVVDLDTLATARATVAFNFHLRMHLNKEEAHLYRIFNERIPLSDQAIIIAKMPQKVPQERFPEAVSWLFSLIGDNDRENMIRIWQQALPPTVFAKVINLIKVAIGDGWEELVRRLPELK